MCGNGVRVFAHYLRASGLERRDDFVVGSLAGPRPVRLHRVDDTFADVTVEMGKANILGSGEAMVGGRRFRGLAVDVGNSETGIGVFFDDAIYVLVGKAMAEATRSSAV